MSVKLRVIYFSALEFGLPYKGVCSEGKGSFFGLIFGFQAVD